MHDALADFHPADSSCEVAAAPPAPASTPQLDEGSPTGADTDGLRQRTSGAQGDVGRRIERVRRARGGAFSSSPCKLSKGAAAAAVAADDGVEAMHRAGFALILASASCFALGLWSMLVGPLCAPSGFAVLDALAGDTHYKYLAVLLVPVTTCFVIVNWWGLKIFRHA
ncbi:hypothetical protein JCM3770_004840 [Rhodotorula araucariae]